MRVVLDLQACQTESRWRGIGRYSYGLSECLLRTFKDVDFHVALDANYSEAARSVLAELGASRGAAPWSWYRYPSTRLAHDDPRDFVRPGAAALIEQGYSRLAADVVHVGSIFEGFAEQAVTAREFGSLPGTVGCATLYDLIPLVFADQYLANPEYRAWYMKRIAVLKSCDLLLAISHATKRDGCNLLGISEERIRVIGGGFDPRFARLGLDRERQDSVLRRYGIREGFLLYTGNDDFRKNMRGALQAYANLPLELRQRHQLVLNQTGDPARWRNVAASFGLSDGEVVQTGFVTDEELAILYRRCALFFFPSLYEGFGLPLVEAMSCGAAVLGSRNSSIPEIIDRDDALFDATNPNAIAEALALTLGNPARIEDLRRWGIERAQTFTWENCAAAAVDAYRDALERKRFVPSVPVSAVLPRRRIAIVTPLPPERSGIANYASELVPALARSLDVDVFTTTQAIFQNRQALNVSVFDVGELEARAYRYDCIVYQFGNSPFHSGMVSLLERHPGVVVLHDFYLSSMLWFMDEHLGWHGLYCAELYRSHGARATSDLYLPGGAEQTRREYPASLGVLQRAILVIAHSEFVNSLRKHFFPSINLPPFRVVPSLRCVAPWVSEAHKREMRHRLGLPVDAWIVCSFGFLADTKLNLEAILGFAQSDGARSGRGMLLFVGENDGGDYGRAVVREIDAHGLHAAVRITGYVDDEEFMSYLAAADIALQLRASSRGETSATVLHCLAHGIPTIVNAHGTMSDFPRNVVSRVPEFPTPKEVALALDTFFSAESLGEMRDRARRYIAEHYSADAVVPAYAVAIEEAIQRRERGSDDNVVRRILDAMETSGAVDPTMLAEFDACSSANRARSQPPQLLIDLSEVVHVDYGTGIHRVVRNLSRSLLGQRDQRRYRPLPVHLDGSRLCVAREYARDRLGSQLPFVGEARIEAGAQLLMLDSAWSEPERFEMLYREIDAAGGDVIGFVYDLIPLRLPETCTPGMAVAFERWIRRMLRSAHAVLCISQATADDLAAWIEESGCVRRETLRIGFVHLGSDLDPIGMTQSADESVIALFTHPTVLMVGTIEPRKDYDTALDAFETMWNSGSPLQLCIFGKPGWRAEHTIARIHGHPELGRRLHWLQDASDGDLSHAYGRARALLQTSLAEGFGLPIVEAQRHGTPVALSDIPVFNEIAGRSATYFAVGDAGAAARAIGIAVEGGKHETSVNAKSWDDTASRVIDIVFGNDWYRVLK